MPSISTILIGNVQKAMGMVQLITASIGTMLAFLIYQAEKNKGWKNLKKNKKIAPFSLLFF